MKSFLLDWGVFMATLITVCLGLIAAMGVAERIWWPTPEAAPVIRPGSKVERCQQEVEDIKRYWQARGEPRWDGELNWQMERCLETSLGR